MATNNREFISDPRVTAFQGRSKAYQIETYNTGKISLLDAQNTKKLVDEVVELYLQTYPDRDQEKSKERMTSGLRHPKTILMMARHDGVTVGFGLFPRFMIDTTPTVYSTRAFTAAHESEGLGTYVLREAIKQHGDELARANRTLRHLVLMTQNPLSVLTAERLEEVETAYPFARPYADTIGGIIIQSEEDKEAQTVMLGVHRLVRMHSRSIDTYTGVSRGEMSEIGMNETYRPDRNRNQRAWEIHQKMVLPPPSGFGMNREAGDEVYVTLRLKRVSNRLAAAAAA